MHQVDKNILFHPSMRNSSFHEKDARKGKRAKKKTNDAKNKKNKKRRRRKKKGRERKKGGRTIPPFVR